jgi:hypothetical protein
VGLDGPRAPDAVFSFLWSSDTVSGVPGTAIGSASKLVMDHGSISPYDLHNTLVLNGPDFREGFRNPGPVGNIDVCPTLTHVLDLELGPAPMDGRVLRECLRDAETSDPAWDTWEDSRTFEARGRTWRQRIWFDRVHQTSYLAGGTVEPA